MKRNKLRLTVCAALVVTVLTAFTAMALEAGSASDPLVTLSYLNETFLPQLLGKVEEKITARDVTLRAELEEEISRAERELMSQTGGSVSSGTGGVAVSFTAVTLRPGQILYGGAGCEVILRSGRVAAISLDGGAPALLDTTAASSLGESTALSENHLYMMPGQRGLAAETETVLLVRGEYLIG